jgi:2-methylcitrate dehydratase PrpD
MGLDAERLHTAVALACATSSGTKAFATGAGGGMEKRMHAGRAAESGMRMAQLASRGFTAPPTALDGRFGLLEVVSKSARRELLSSALGERWAIEHVYVKIYPCCAWIQAAVQQLVALRGPRALEPGEIARVTIGVSAYAAKQNSNVAPPDTMGAQFSIPYCTALALTGDPENPASYAGAAIDDPGRRELARRIEIVVDPQMEAAYPRHYGASVDFELVNGDRRSSAVLDPHGMPADPCTESEVLSKFQKLASRVLSPARSDQVVTMVRSAEQRGSARELGALLRNAQR